MICRRCGMELPDNALRCTNCGTKLNMYCPKCKTINIFGEKICKNCGFELLKTCSVCGCLNFFSSTKCRKCDTDFVVDNINSDNVVESQSSDFEVVRSYSTNQTSYIASEITGLIRRYDR